MAEKEENKSSGKEKRIQYVGQDIGYWNDLIKKYQAVYPDKEFEFIHTEVKKANKVKECRKEITEKSPHILFLDNALFPLEMLRLNLDLKNDPATDHVIVISLLPNLNSRDAIRQSLALGVKMNFIKGIDLSSVVHHSMRVAFPSEYKKLEFATAKVQFQAQAMDLFNIGFVSNNFIRIETNYKFQVGQEFFLNTGVFGKLKLSDYFKVAKVHIKNIYTQYRIAYDLEYIHRDEAKLRELELKIATNQNILKKDKDDAKAKMDLNTALADKESVLNEEEANTRIMTKKIKEWIINNSDFSRPKRSRILIIDRELALLNMIPGALEDYSFSVRIKTTVTEKAKVIDHIFPGIIAYVLEEPLYHPEDVEEADKNVQKEDPKKVQEKQEEEPELNDVEALCRLIKKIDTIENYKPFILLFNCYVKTDVIKEKTGYQKIMGTRGEISLDVIEDILKKYNEMHGRNITHAEEYTDTENQKHYISKFKPESVGEYVFPIEVTSISEGELHFSSTENIPPYATLYIKDPVKMTLTVIPEGKEEDNKPKSVKDKGPSNYYALISGLGEVETNNLRKYVNKLFFKELEKKRAEEKAKFEEVQQKALEEKKEREELGLKGKK